ncbi:MAG: thymidylate kinase [Spirochaetes bacterium DG_61]|jgi:dTMP kinase|nr:MAG: thymidylate kinase [Spirochaetes bacterium DG_61]
MSPKQCYGNPPHGMDPGTLSGALIVIEGSDSSGRSTQVCLLSEWLEQKGYAVTQTGLTRSQLVGPAITAAKEGNILSPRTMSLFYATDFYDQMENVIVPSLRAGYIVLADRYIFTLMARDLVRGANPEWVESLYSMALVPDAVYFIMASSRNLVERTLSAHNSLDYWESGMDIGISRDWYESFVRYQKALRLEYNNLQKKYGLEMIDANRSINSVQRILRTRIESVLENLYATV